MPRQAMPWRAVLVGRVVLASLCGTALALLLGAPIPSRVILVEAHPKDGPLEVVLVVLVTVDGTSSCVRGKHAPGKAG
jgi:hypothetical protein